MRNTTRIRDGGNKTEWVNPSSKIVNEVAQAKGVDMLALEPLYHTLDVDALDDLLRTAKSEIEVTFEYEGYNVRIRGDGQLRLER